MEEEPVFIGKEAELNAWLADPANEGHVVRTRLRASDRVIARVTDGIYREPASALRELISNAWDADASSVTILTDVPRFSRIYIRDDGRGMSHAALSRLVNHIGGSPKRTEDGQALGVSSTIDPDKTPSGRPLIGKLGIGLFSVSQLARRFQIITKVKGEPYRLTAEVRLRAYTEEEDEDGEERDAATEADDEFITGDVLITREPTRDLDAHGTDIVLESIKPRVKAILRSDERWRAIAQREEALAAGDLETAAGIRAEAPRFHAGWIGPATNRAEQADILVVPAELPWSAEDPAADRMGKLFDGIESEFSRKNRPDLRTSLDKYLETLWELGLSAPLPYIDEHPFDKKQDGTFRLFWLANEERGRALEIPMSKGETVRAAVHDHAPGQIRLDAGATDPAGGFSVHIDGVDLLRPVRFRFQQTERRGLDKALLFVGKYEPDLTKAPEGQSGGRLSLEGYLFWNGRIVPKENNGVLVRIRNSGGALFDSTFFDYQISEQTRLRQITSELFIAHGLDAALNLDRESFNYSHPHVQLVSRWLHRAIRQLTNRHKEESKTAKGSRDQEDAAAKQDAVQRFAGSVWNARRGSEPSPDVEISPSASRAQAARNEGYLALAMPTLPALAAAPPAEKKVRGSQAEALVTVLAAYGVLEDRSYEDQQELVSAILSIFLGVGE